MKPIKFNDLSSCLKQIENISEKEIVEKKDDIMKKISPTIIIAEDIILNMILIESLLKKIMPKAKIIKAINGLEVIEKMNKEVNLILMDIQMPEMDGIEAAKIIRENKEYEKTPILALTAGVTQKDKEICMESGMNDFLSKPLVLKDLTKMIKKYILK